MSAPTRDPGGEKAMPINLDAERAVLGSCLLNRDAVVAIAGWLTPDDFYVEQHARIFAAILACYQARIPPDARTVAEELRRRGELDALGGPAALSALVDGIPTSYHVEYYGRIVERAALLRRLIATGGRIAALGYDEQEDVAATLGKAEELIFALAQRRSRDDFVLLSEVVDGYYEQLAARQEQAGALMGAPTGLRDLDRLTGGMQPSDLLILAARPSVGKTSLALSIAYHLAVEQRRMVGVFSLEMSREQLLHRLLALHTGIDAHRVRLGDLRGGELERLVQALGELADAPLAIEDSAGLTLSELRSKARRLQSQRSLDLLIVDYLQLVQGSRRAENRVQEVSEIARGLKVLARELGVPVLALSQLSRAVEGRADKVPLLSDLRESGEIEQAADLVMFIHREELYDRDPAKVGMAELHVAKHRNGPVGVVPLYFEANTTRFRSLSQRMS